MATREQVSNAGLQKLLAPVARTTTVLSAEVDMQGFESLTLVGLLGASAATLSGSIKVELEVQHADDDGTGSAGAYTAVADADIVGAVTGSATGTFAVIDADAKLGQLYKTAYRGTKRFVKVNVRLTGNHSTGTLVAVAAIKGNPSIKPVA
jgi:hypothetical protein